MATATAAALLRSSAGRALRPTSAVVCKPVMGSHVLRVDGYSHLIEAVAKDESVKSSAFYVGGHSWRLVLYPNGSSSSEHDGSMGVFLRLESDPAGGHAWARAQFSILDQLANPCPVRKTQLCTFNQRGIYWGYADLISKEKLEKSEYLRDDSFAPSSATPPSQLLRSALIIRSLFLETPHLELPSSPKS